MKPYFEDAFEKMIFSYLGEQGRGQPAFFEQQLKNYPKYLYKYRTCDKKHNFDMITQEYLWADIPENFSDPYDSLVHLKYESEAPKIRAWLYQHMGEILYYNIPPKGMHPHKNGQTLKSYLAAQEQFLDISGRYNAKKAQHLMLVELNRLPQGKRKEVQRAFEYLEGEVFQNKLEKAIFDSIEREVNVLRRSVKVCCLTTRRDNRNMWENYAAQYTGFVIEYEVARVREYPEAISHLERMFPVSYYKRLPKVALLPFIQRDFAKTLYNREIDILPTIKRLYKQTVSKDYDYRAEEEWRILASTSRIVFPLVSAVYAGYKMPNETLEQLKTCCKQSGVELYKQKLGIFNDAMTYEQIL